MNRTIFVALGTGAVISSAAAIGIGAAVTPAPQQLSLAEYEAATREVDATREELSLRCESVGESRRELCLAQAAAHEMVRVADIEVSFRRTPQAARAAQRARIDAAYLVERARCFAVGGLSRDQCLVSVHAARGRALLEAAAPYEVRFQAANK